jgi:hypothetical protein
MIHIIQISDCHFGLPFSNTRKHWLSKGLNIHDFRLCEALNQFVNDDLAISDEISDGDELLLIINGDLTSKGHADEFQVANTFMHAEHSMVSRNRVFRIGLKWTISDLGNEATFASIPGNHDHGNGVWVWPFVFGYSPQIYNEFFDTPPFVSRTQSSDGLELCIFGIDSCSMYAEREVNFAPAASGGFSRAHRTAFRKLVEDELRRPMADDCRLRTAVILCHHPWTRDGSAGALCPFCVVWLQQLAVEFGIPVVFTGHTHRSLTQLYASVDQSGLSRSVREVRCPTTLQYPAEFNPEYQSPGLWWHKVGIKGDRVVWEGCLLCYNGSSFSEIVDRQKPEVTSGKKAAERVYSFKDTVDGTVVPK